MRFKINVDWQAAALDVDCRRFNKLGASEMKFDAVMVRHLEDVLMAYWMLRNRYRTLLARQRHARRMDHL